MKLLETINLENVSESEAGKFRVREAARAVVFDAENRVALLHATKNEYYKLPGGGLEGAEDPKDALRRECKEEIGCDIEITGELGIIIEYRKKQNLRQTSYCYFAKVLGEKGTPELMDDEAEEGFETIWLPLDEAIVSIKGSSTTAVYEAAYMVKRDLKFLMSAVK